MESTFTERKALKEYVAWIREERRRLGDEYWKAIERIRELDANAEVNNVSVETVDRLAEVINRQNEVIERLNDLMPKIPVEVAVKQLQNITGNVTVTEDQLVKAKVMEEAINYKERKAIRKGRTNLDIKSLSYDVVNYLNEQGRPVKMAEIAEYLKEIGAKVANPTNLMKSIMSYQVKVERVMKGYYQIKK